MTELPAPMEFLELSNGGSASFHVEGYELGETMISPRRSQDQRIAVVQCLRLYVPRDEKPIGVPWWDITAMGCIAQLMPLLEDIIKRKKRVTLTAHGFGTSKRFSISVG